MRNWKKTFYTIWVGQAFSQLSSSILQFAIVWYLTDKTKSGIVLSMAMLVGFLPQGVLGPFIGVYIDRLNRKMIMAVSDLAIAAASLVLAVCAFGGELPVWLVLAVLLIRAIGTAFHTPTLQAVTPQLVPKEELTKCAGYTQSLQSVSQILSPALAAVLYNMWSLSAIILLDVAGAVLAVAFLAVCQIPKHEGSSNTEKVHVVREAVEGFHILCTKKGMLGLVLVSSLYTVALMPVSALFPLMSMGRFGGTSTHASVVEVIFSLGFFAGALILGKWGGTKNKIYTILGSYVLMAVCLFGSGLLPPGGYVVFCIFSGLMGVSGPFYWGMYTPILQERFEEKYMGRVLSITGSIRLITGPVALVISGIFADYFGEENWFLVAGVIVTIAAICCIAIPSIRNCDKAENELYYKE